MCFTAHTCIYLSIYLSIYIYTYIYIYIERERERERETERDRDRQTDRQIDRQTDRDRKYNKVQTCLGLETFTPNFRPSVGWTDSYETQFYYIINYAYTGEVHRVLVMFKF